MPQPAASRDPGILPAAASVLAVCAHPDDESFGLGAVLDGFARQGTRLGLLCFTSGGASTIGAGGGELATRRRVETEAAAAELGIVAVEVLDHPDGGLPDEPVGVLAGEVAAAAARVGADLVLVFDEGGVTGHPDHHQATAAALAGAPELPVLAWTVPRPVAERLNGELGTGFVGRDEEEIDLTVAVDRARQRAAAARHASQSTDNPVLDRRLELLGDREHLRWLRRPAAGSSPAVDPSTAALAEEWDRRYASRDRLFRAEPDETLVELVAPLAPGRAVDLGAGEGRNALWLAARGWQVTAVDLSRQGLRRLEEAAAEDGLTVTTEVGDLAAAVARAAARGETFDLVVLAYLHPDPAARLGLLRSVASVVAPGGHLFVVAHHRFAGGPAGHFDPARLYDAADLRAGAAGLDLLRLDERRGHSDVEEPGTDLVLWARRPLHAPPA